MAKGPFAKFRSFLFYSVKIKILYPIYCAGKRMIGSPLHLPYTYQGQAASDAIHDLLASGKPCMITRYGGTEIRALTGYLDTIELLPLQKLFRKLTFRPVGVSKTVKRLMWDGDFFSTDEHYERFAKLLDKDGEDIDLLGAWRPEEVRVVHHPERVISVPIAELEPYHHKRPWSRVLKGKKVLVIHPFVESVEAQYAKRELLFDNPDVLPEFELITYRPVFRALGTEFDTRFSDWFEALDHMKDAISKLDFDVAIIGAGPYGLHLAAHIKRMGRQAVHLGGSTQVLFGIKGTRYDKLEQYNCMYNEHWRRPLPSETPGNAQQIEHRCYW